MRKGSLDLLLLLFEKGAGENAVKISTGELAGLLGISQQSASRWLGELEDEGLVERAGWKTAIAGKGLEELKNVLGVLKKEFEESGKKKLVFEGVVFSGMRDGQYYLSLEGYKKQFEEKLGFTPFPGTLNLKANSKNARAGLSKGIVVEGFAEGERIFGKIFVFPARINGKIKGALIVPERTHYGGDVLEIVAKENLREKLKVKDGDSVKVELV